MKHTAIVVFILVTSLVAGCATLFGNNQASNVSTAYPTAWRSELLQGIEASYNESATNHHYNDYEVTWMGNTTIIVHMKITSDAEVTMWDYKFTHFLTIEAATAYFDSHKVLYTNKSDTVDHASLYAHVTGVKYPSALQEVTIPAGNTTYHLEQIDALIIESSASVMPPVNATVTATATTP